MSATSASGSEGVFHSPRRLVIFGVTGQLGQELIDRLDECAWPISELIGVASQESVGESFDFRGDDLDVVGEWPSLKGFDLVFVCTRGVEALEIVRECLRAEVPCIDLTGALSTQDEVPLPATLGPAAAADDPLRSAPLIGLPSATTLAWARVISAVGGVSRVIGTVLSSASAMGRRGLVSLSDESIALFNQSEPEVPGPAGQSVAFDVLPGGGIDPERIGAELVRLFGEALRIDVAGVQVPAFVGEGTSLLLELEGELERAELEARLGAGAGISLVAEGLGSRGLAAVEEGAAEPVGPTLRDAGGTDAVWVGRIAADSSLPAGQGWRLWLASDPVRLIADHAIRVAGRRLGIE